MSQQSRHPERFELPETVDGIVLPPKPRMIRVCEGQAIRGTFPLDAPTVGDSRQARRFKIRTAAFNELSRYSLPRTVRRAAAINARLEAE
jgi:hypothetical protein